MSLTTDTQTILDDSGVFWPVGQIYHAINETLLVLWPKLQTLETRTEILVGAGEDLVALPTTEIMVPKYLVGIIGTYFPTTHAKLEQYSRTWRSATPAMPKHFVLWDCDHLRPWPVADFDYAFDVYGVPWPEEVSATTPDLDIDPLLKQSIANHAAGRLMVNTRPDAAKEALAEAGRLLHDYQVRQRNQQGHMIYRLRPGTLFTAAQSGSIRLGKRLS